MEDSQSIRSEPNTKLHRLYQLSKSLLYLSPPLPTSPIGFFWSGEMASGETRGGADLGWHRAGIFGFLASGILAVLLDILV